MKAGDIVVFTDQAVACGALGRSFDYRGKWAVIEGFNEVVQIRRVGPHGDHLAGFVRCNVARAWLVLLDDFEKTASPALVEARLGLGVTFQMGENPFNTPELDASPERTKRIVRHAFRFRLIEGGIDAEYRVTLARDGVPLTTVPKCAVERLERDFHGEPSWRGVHNTKEELIAVHFVLSVLTDLLVAIAGDANAGSVAASLATFGVPHLGTFTWTDDGYVRDCDATGGL